MENTETVIFELTSENVENTFKDCMFDEEEIKDGRPTCDFIIAEGISKTVAFNAEKINRNKSKIAQLVDMLPGIDEGQLFSSLCNDKNDHQ